MRILWVVNTVFPEALSSLTGKACNLTGSGGWLQASAEALVRDQSVDLCVATVSKLVNEPYKYQGKSILYYILPIWKGNLRANSDYIPSWQMIGREFKPELIHIHGTEWPHGLILLEALPYVPSVISIQGLISQIWAYYNAGISNKEILRNITLRDMALDILRPREMCGTLFSKKRHFRIRAASEPLFYQKAKAVIGRTFWDKEQVLNMNPRLKYFFCNETLRPQFYQGKWSYSACIPHTIFLSQMTYPFKGLHMVLKALPTVLKEFPDTKVIAAGDNKTNDGYSKYLRRLMQDLGIDKECIHFTGPLDAGQMKEQYLSCNVFISSSAIENSSNSICEAQLLGVPCIATDTGGTRDLIKDERCGLLYDFKDTARLSSLIIKTFKESPSFDGSFEQSVAMDRHNPAKNAKRIMEIYSEVVRDWNLF